MTEPQTTSQICNTLHIPTREEFHKNFGGTIHQFDFNTDYRGKDNINGSTIAKRIESDKMHFAKLGKEGKFKELSQKSHWL